MVVVFVFPSGGGDVRMGSVSGISSGGCGVDQLERTSPRGLVRRDILHTTRANLWPGQTQVKASWRIYRGAGHRHLSGIVSPPANFASLPCFEKERSDIGSSVLFFFLSFFPPPRRYYYFLQAGSRSRPSFHPAYNYRSFFVRSWLHVLCHTGRGNDV